MIYTSYFAKLRYLPERIIPISICWKAPEWYNGLEYKKLAPNYDFFMEWKGSHDNVYYTQCYNDQVLTNLNAHKVVHDLYSLSSLRLLSSNEHENVFCKLYDKDIALICYERPCEFCHRRLVASWLRANGYECEELYL